jgi:hypothetical protein
MFEYGDQLANAVISGVHRNIWPSEQAVVMAVDYMLKGLLRADEVGSIIKAVRPTCDNGGNG